MQTWNYTNGESVHLNSCLSSVSKIGWKCIIFSGIQQKSGCKRPIIEHVWESYHSVAGSQWGREDNNIVHVDRYVVSISFCNTSHFRKLLQLSLGLPLWSSGQSFWLQIQRFRVRFPALPDFLSSSGSGTGSTQPREVNWGATWIKNSGSGPENRD